MFKKRKKQSSIAKKAVSVLLSVLMVSSVGSAAVVSVGAVESTEVSSGSYGDYEYGDYYYNFRDDGTVSITGYHGSAENTVIPSEIDGKSVTYIYDAAFCSAEGLKSVTIPDSVTGIGDHAFLDCVDLTRVTIGNSVTSIGYKAFIGCTSLSSVNIPDSVKSFGAFAFAHCSSLTEITIPNSVTSIEAYAFYGCTSLASITVPDIMTIPDSMISIDSDAFYDTPWYNNQPEGLVYFGKIAYQYKGEMPENTEIVLKDGTLGINRYAFKDCTGLTGITIPNSVTIIGESAFDGCTGLTSVTIPDSVTEIPYGAFSGCTGLTSVTLPNGISTIDWYAFADCTSLTSITIPDSVTSIGSSAFSGCTGLTSINIPDSVTSIWGGAFSGCTGLTSITIPDSVTSIGYNAFSGCTGLTSVTIPDSVTSIGDDAFYNTAWYDNQPDGLVYAGKVAYNYKGTMPDNTEIILKDGTLGIAANAFENCTGLTSITIPDSVSSIDTYTFRGCTSLTSITIPDSVTNIGYSAFSNTAWYNNQPDGLVYMGNLAYEYKGEMPENTEIVLKDGTTGIVNRAFSRCTGLTSITIPDSVTSIGESAFSRCTGLTSITIPDSVTNIGYEAFGYYYENDKSGLEKNVNFTVNGYTGTAAEKYASDNGLKFVALDYTLQDNKTGISLDIKNNAELIVETLTDSESLDKANVALADKAEVLALYDITLLADGVAVQPDGTAKVRIPTDNANAKVYRIEEDGTATDMNAVYENGYLVFTTDHFSVYAVAEPITALLGDVNGDGELTIADAILAQKYISGIITLEGDALTAADVTKDGSVSIADAIILQKYISNIITEL